MTTPPWGHKPPPVDDIEAYWNNPPPALSERCEYWLRRYREGSWKPNKHLARECYDCRAGKLGVYIWESVNVFAPLIDDYYAKLKTLAVAP